MKVRIAHTDQRREVELHRRYKLASLRSGSICAAPLLVLAASFLPAGAEQAGPPLTVSPVTTSPASLSNPAAREVAAFASAWASVTGYSARVTIFDQKGAQSQNLVFDYTFRKPSDVTVDVLAGPNAGVTLTWNGGATVVARRGGGLAGLFKRTLSLHDPLVTTLRGSSIDQLSFGAILLHGQRTGALSAAPGDVIDGAAVNSVMLTPAATVDDAGLTREIVELSTVTHLPVRVLGYEGSLLVRRIDFSSLKLQT